MSNSFRKTAPQRTFTGTYTNYRSYKPYLAKDFNSRCGYTDCSDFWFGGKNNFHIDHFHPSSSHPLLVATYSNLIYCCSYVNILKSDDTLTPYLDPCNDDLNNHFERDDFGNILPLSSSVEAPIIYAKLKLYMKRYGIIWMLDNLQDRMERLRKAINATKDGDLKKELLVAQGELANMFIEYIGYLKAEQ